MIAHLLAAIASLLLLGLSCVARPERVHVNGRAFWINGVRPDGNYELRRLPADPDRGEDPPGVVYGRVYCTGGALAIVVDHETIGCQR